MTGWNHSRKIEAERCIPTRIGSHGGAALKGFAFPIPRGIAGGVTEELDGEGGVGCAVQRSSHCVGVGRSQHRVVLEVVRASVTITGVVGCNPITPPSMPKPLLL